MKTRLHCICSYRERQISKSL